MKLCKRCLEKAKKRKEEAKANFHIIAICPNCLNITDDSYLVYSKKYFDGSPIATKCVRCLK